MSFYELNDILKAMTISKRFVHRFLALTLILHYIEADYNYNEFHDDDDEVYLPRFKLNNEKRLINDLLNNYKVKFGRPVANRSENIVVKFEVYLVQIIDLDERNQVLISNVETQYVWKDNGLIWNKDNYGGVEDVRLPVSQIWTPDIVLYNYADTRLEEKREVLAVVSSDGKVRWRPSCIYKSTCQINIQNFPYDHQNCHMKFGSWTYDGDSIDIQFLDKPEINRELFLTSNEWDVISTEGRRNEKKYECCKEYFPDITYEIKMKRKGGFYNYILVLPCILLSFLTTVLFWLPPESPAKMLLGMNIFTSFFVLLLLLSKNVPSATDKIPLIGAYYCLNMVMIATSTCACTVVVHIFFRGNGRVPLILRKIFLEFFARVLCMIAIESVRDRQVTGVEIDVRGEQCTTLVTTSNNNVAARSFATLHESTSKSQTKICESRTSLNSEHNDINHKTHNSLVKESYQKPSQITLKSFDSLDQSNQTSRQFSISKLVSYTQCKNSMSLTEADMNRPLPTASAAKKANSAKHRRSPKISSSTEHMLAHHRNDKLNQDLNLSFNVIENDIKEIRDYLRHTRKRIEVKDTNNQNTNEWKQLALVLDRVLFYTYIIVIVVSVTLMFPR